MDKEWIVSVDLDGVLCKPISQDRYAFAEPIRDNIAKVNKLKEKGWRVVIHTARGWYGYAITYQWLKKYNVQYDQLVMGKLYAHRYVDDLNATLDECLEQEVREERECSER